MNDAVMSRIANTICTKSVVQFFYFIYELLYGKHMYNAIYKNALYPTNHKIIGSMQPLFLL